MKKPRSKKEKQAAKIKAAQCATVGALINSALHYLGETTLPYVVIIGEKILTNAPTLHAQAIIVKQARLIDKLQEIETERAAERAADYGNNGF